MLVCCFYTLISNLDLVFPKKKRNTFTQVVRTFTNPHEFYLFPTELISSDAYLIFVSGNPSYNEYYALTQTIIEEIRKGFAHIAAQDLVLLSHALNKMKNLKDVLERIIGSLEHEDVCQEFTRLSSILTSFILRNEHLVNVKEKVEEQPILKSAIQFAPSSSAGGRPLMLLPVDEINNLRCAGLFCRLVCG